ncbi:MAG: hypothetical protein AAF741_15565 [Bacteroidota bacterium]
MKPIYLLLLILCTSFSCGSPLIYESENMERAISRHEIIAILPADVSISGRPKDDPEALRQFAEFDRLNFQTQIIGWMLRRKQQNRIFVNILDRATTNARLTEMGYFDDITTSYTPAELADFLDVDAVVLSNFRLSKPMSDGANLAIGMISGVWGNANQTEATLDIHDGRSGELLWNYNWVAGGTAFVDHGDLVNGLMRNASRRMPYVVRR